MARLPRLALDQQLHHVLSRAAPGTSVWLCDQDGIDYADALLTVSREADVAIHAYALLPDRVHLLLTPRRGADLSLMMQRLGRRYVGAFNARHGRHGTPWAGRYRTTVLQAERWFIDALRRVETAPVLSGLADQPDRWGASSAAHHLGGRTAPLVTEHPLFWTLGNTPFEREAAYRRLCNMPLSDSVVQAIDDATDAGWALGDAEYVASQSAQQARRLQPKARGRPRTLQPANNSDPI